MAAKTHYRSSAAKKIRHRVGLGLVTGGIVSSAPRLIPVLAANPIAGAIGLGIGSGINYGMGRGATGLVQKLRRKKKLGGWRRG